MDEQEFTIQQVIIERQFERPAHIPADWIIFNAPRPLYGETWQGSFLRGRFYAACNPADPFHKGFIEENRRLDACILEFISEKVILDYAAGVARDYGVPLDEFDFSDMLSSYTHKDNSQWRRKMSLQAYLLQRESNER